MTSPARKQTAIFLKQRIGEYSRKGHIQPFILQGGVKEPVRFSDFQFADVLVRGQHGVFFSTKFEVKDDQMAPIFEDVFKRFFCHIFAVKIAQLLYSVLSLRF